MENNQNLENNTVSPTTPSPKPSTSGKHSKKRWVPSNEKETYSTVVVNYYGKNRKRKSATNSRMIDPTVWLSPSYDPTLMSEQSCEEEDDIFNLNNLYEECRNSKVSMGMKSHKQIIEVEVYSVPAELKASLLEPQIEIARSYIIEDTSDDDNDTDEYSDKQAEDDSEQTEKAILAKPNDSQTKSTQNPERGNCSQQMPSNLKLGDTHDKNTECPSQPKLKVKPTTSAQPNFRQRQLELHRYRVLVEQKRLDLLEMKLKREREDMIREKILFEKDLEIRVIRQVKEERA